MNILKIFKRKPKPKPKITKSKPEYVCKICGIEIIDIFYNSEGRRIYCSNIGIANNRETVCCCCKERSIKQIGKKLSTSKCKRLNCPNIGSEKYKDRINPYDTM